MHRTQLDQTEFARTLRADSTEAEMALWRRLRSRQLGGAKFRRQYVMGPYVADLVCVDSWLVVECDGGQHADSTHDAVRDAWMLGQGWQVLRFWNHEVLQNMEGVLVVIAEALISRRGGHQPSPQPSPLKGEGEDRGIPPSPFKGEGWGEGQMPAPPPNHNPRPR